MGRRRGLHADLRRLRLRARVRHRAQVARDAALSDRAHLDQHDPRLRGTARAGAAAVVLTCRYGCRPFAAAQGMCNAAYRARASWRGPVCAELHLMSFLPIVRLLTGALVLTLAVPGLAQDSFDGTWVLRRTFTANGKGAGCGPQGVDFRITIRSRVVLAPGGKGSVSPSGQIRFPGTANYFT